MHAILGLAASDLTQRDPSLVASAMHHRVKAIKAIKKTLAEAPKANSFEEGNAMMATCFALTFQSVLLDDGMTEYMTFIRGVVIVAIQMYIKGANLIFADFLGDKQQEVLQPFIENMPLIERSWVDSAVVAVESLSPLCQHPIEQQYYEKILDMAKQLGVSSWGGELHSGLRFLSAPPPFYPTTFSIDVCANSWPAYKAMTTQYGWWMMLPHDQFQRVIDTTNQVNILLSAHWIALKQIMAIITEKEYEAGARPQNATEGGVEPGMLRWLKYLNRLVDAEHKVYNQWPVWVETQLDRDPCFFGKTR